MEAAVVTVWRMASNAKAAEAERLLDDAGWRTRHKGRTLTVSHHPDAADGVTAMVGQIDPDAERQNQ
jgi:hypothetical protein